MNNDKQEIQETMVWTIREVETLALPPFAVGYYKEVEEGHISFVAVAYCYTYPQAQFIMDSFDAQAWPADWEKWEADQEAQGSKEE